MQQSEERFRERNRLSTTFMELNMPVCTMVNYTAKMRSMSETEKEAYAKALRLKLQSSGMVNKEDADDAEDERTGNPSQGCGGGP